ncbi:MAG: LacI family DNA-binding transcriptional regulator [Christensenellales bacterium]|jgi:LacI family transcriptional regulator
MSKPRVTLRDIARAQGVSVNTVSRALRNMPDISPQTCQAIQNTAREMGYRANLTARSLRTRRSHALGVLIPDIANPFFAEMINGIESGCHSLGYTLIVSNTGESARRERDAVDTMLSRGVDGVILIPTADGAANAARLAKAGMPYVLLCRRLAGISAHLITSDEVEAGAMAARHLWEKGHRRFCLITAPLTVSSASDRCEGFRRYLIAQGAQPGDLIVRETDFTWQGGYRTMRAVLDEEAGVTAVIGFSDFIAAGMLRALTEHGVRVPADIAVVGFDGTPMGELLSPSLTTVDIRAGEQGRRAVHMLSEIINTAGEPKPRLIVSHPHLIARQST